LETETSLYGDGGYKKEIEQNGVKLGIAERKLVGGNALVARPYDRGLRKKGKPARGDRGQKRTTWEVIELTRLARRGNF